jgi:hypothetical protein
LILILALIVLIVALTILRDGRCAAEQRESNGGTDQMFHL